MRFFKPAWMSKNETRACAAVDAMQDEATLRRIVEEAPLQAARIRAAHKVNDQQLYQRLAKSDDDEYVRYRMAMAVTDVDFLWEFIGRGDCARYVVSDVRERIDTLVAERRIAESRAELAEIPSMDDASRLVEIATSNYLNDADRPSVTAPRILNAPTPKTIGDEKREAAVNRLAEIGADAALAEVARSRDAQLSGTAERAASRITSQRLLFELAQELSDSTAYNARKATVQAITDRTLLDELSKLQTKQRLGELRIEELAKRRLQELQSEDVCHGEHDWDLVRSDTDEVGEFRYFEYDYQCRRCGIERHERVRQ